MYLEITKKKVKQLFIDFFSDANNLINIPKEYRLLLHFGITLIFKKIRKYFPKVHYIMSISMSQRTI